MSFVPLAILIAGPAIAGLVALYMGLKLLRRSDRPYANTKFRQVLGILCLVVAAGIGTCYGVVFLTR